ncbi:MAG: MiaB/RimO family radical SAM methylthiotransferase, partial [Methylocystis sp.]
MKNLANKLEVISFGCRLNSVDSENLAQDYVSNIQKKNSTILINTCAVTAEAMRQATQSIRRAHRENPEAEIVVAGCAARIEPEIFENIPGVSQVLRNQLPMQARVASEGTRGLLAIQNGCDHQCTFCIIPQGRGPSRSASSNQILQQVEYLLEIGKKEIVLTGVDLTSYQQEGLSLGGLVRLILKEFPELPRLRLSSIDCVEADDQLLQMFAEDERLCPHLHLSLQSGNDLILKRMKRRHLRADSIQFCANLRKARPDVIFGADFIVGFPTETDEMFEDTCKLVDECGLTYLHVFPFSPRPETPAAKMKQTTREITKIRSEKLRQLGAQKKLDHLDKCVGRTFSFLTEKGGVARAPNFSLAKTPGKPAGVFLDM